MDSRPLERVNCYFCGDTEAAVWGVEAGYQAVKCATCGLVYVSPRPRLEHIDEAARTGQHATEAGLITVTGSYRHRRVRKHERVLRRLLEGVANTHPVRWLDIGAGFGELVEAAENVFPRAEVLGIEPNEAKRRSALERGITLSGARLAELPEARFHVVSLMNVWSHLPDPPTFFSDVRKLLTDGGRVLVQTGAAADLANAGEYPDTLLLPDHLSFAGERHVVGTLARAGFHVEAISRERADTLEFALVQAAKRLLGRPTRLVVPYQSPFRIMYVVAKAQP